MPVVDRLIDSSDMNSSAKPSWSPALLLKLSLAAHGIGVLAIAIYPTYWAWVLVGLVADHIIIGFAGLYPKSRLLGPNIVHLPSTAGTGGQVALTFDDGPDPETTPRILDFLDLYGAKASFFCIGEKVAAHPEIVRDIVCRGHSVENHSYRHSYAFAFYGPGKQYREIKRAQDVIETVTGRSPLFFRAPVGFRNLFLDPVLTWQRLRYVSWTRRGYDAVHGNTQKVLARLTNNLAGGDILLMHDGGSAKTMTGEPVVITVLPLLLDRLAQQRLKAVSLPMATQAVLEGLPA